MSREGWRTIEKVLENTVRDIDLQHETDWRKIVKLNSLERPGLSEKDLFSLFAKCDTCWLIMARLVFDYHKCRPQIGRAHV